MISQDPLALHLPPPRTPSRSAALAANAERRARRRLPTRHAAICAELRRACLLPAPGPDISEAERRAVRNKLKAMRRAGR